MNKNKNKREGMLPAHIFKKLNRSKDVDIDPLPDPRKTIKDIFPQYDKKKYIGDENIKKENEKLKSEIGILNDEILALKEKFDQKLGTKKDLIEKIEILEKENEELRSEVEELSKEPEPVELEDQIDSEKE